MAKIYNLFNETDRQKLPMEQEEEIITKMYEEYYAEPEEPDEYCEVIGHCCKCGLPIKEYEAMWQINKVNKFGSLVEEDSMVVCEYCLTRFI